ncbi:MAG TPA: sialate O-acetylesterase [Candidatus Limiplasma sp.]|nr:sialate O-acetylesterase [Candidatus Limiplasma sp.]
MEPAFSPAAVFGDRMVLCRNRPITIFGTARNGVEISVRINGQSACEIARNGRFEVTLAPMPAGGPYTLSLTDGQTERRFTDVLIGDVYFAGGQSNMEMELKDSDDGARLTATSDDPLIRYYNVPKLAVADVALLAAEQASGWKTVRPGDCGDISAVAYHFAARLRAELDVPVGIIDCYWGGTSVACWLDEAALRATDAGEALWTEFTASIAAKSDAECDAEVRAHDEKLEDWNRSVEKVRAEHPGIPWPEVAALVAPCPWNPPASRKSGFRPAGLAETMVKRVAPCTLTGILYYQGEEDTKHPGLYRELMGSLITFWRGLFRDPELPFLYAQLPMFRNSYEADDHRWAELRQAQEQVWLAARNVGLAVLIDAGELDNIHPTDKKTVGDRLFQQALRVVYGRADAPESPRARYVWREGTELVVELTAAVTARGEPALFELADEKGVFVPADATLEGRRIRLSAEGMARPLAARYAWVNYGCVNVFGTNGLPLAPFKMG